MLFEADNVSVAWVPGSNMYGILTSLGQCIVSRLPRVHIVVIQREYKCKEDRLGPLQW